MILPFYYSGVASDVDELDKYYILEGYMGTYFIILTVIKYASKYTPQTHALT